MDVYSGGKTTRKSLTLLYPSFLGLLGLFLPAGHDSSLAYAKNFKFGME